MKRQVAITGPTPEFVRWSIRQSCLLRRDTDIDSVDQTEKRLRAVRAAGLAIGQGRVHDGIAVRHVDGRPKGFRVEEVFSIWGGLGEVRQSCGACPANVLSDPQGPGALAGCHGWLARQAGDLDLGITIDVAVRGSAASARQALAEQFLETTPAWYGLWAGRVLESRHFGILLDVLDRAARDHPDAGPPLREFRQVIEVCLGESLVLDVELVPAGFSDGLHWTIAPHCDRCKAPATRGQTTCGGCGKSGRGHPLIRRKVLGLRPYIDLGVLLGPRKAGEFLRRHQL